MAFAHHGPRSAERGCGSNFTAALGGWRRTNREHGGWVGQAILGQLYKVTPFLMWYYRATITDVLAIPRQPAPYNPRPGRIALVLSNGGVACLVGGTWIGASSPALVGAVLWAAAAVLVAYVLAYRWIPPAVSRALVFEWRWRIW